MADFENMSDEELDAEVQHVMEWNKAQVTAQREILRPVCEALGYGFVMDQAARMWQEIDPMGAFTVGPCKGGTVPCGCKDQAHCNWCYGSGWLTKHVKEIKDQLG